MGRSDVATIVAGPYDRPMATKARLSASVDKALLAQVARAVRAGRAPTVSAWVDDALRKKLADETRLAAFDAYLADYEREFGVITEEEIRAARVDMKARAIRTGKSSRRRRAR
jgi:hypothetical protein